jgi:MFS family permease
MELKSLILFTLVYIFNFSGTYTVFSFLNILYPKDAFIVFAIYYGTFAISSLFAPFILYKDNSKLMIILGSLAYCVSVTFSSMGTQYLLFSGAILNGIGNCVFWFYQGILLDGKEMGIFYSFFTISNIFGNIIALIILITGLEIQIMMYAIIGLPIIGTIFSLFITTNKNNDKHNNNDEQKDDDLKWTNKSFHYYTFTENMESDSVYVNNYHNDKFIIDESYSNNENKYLLTNSPVNDNKWHKILSTFKIIKKCYFIVPSILYQALSLNIAFQIIPRYLLLMSETTISINIYNVIIFIVYGIFAMIFGYIWSYLILKSWTYVVIPYSILEIIFCFGISLYNDHPGYYIIFGAIRGTIDYGINNNINISLSRFCPEDVRYLFSLYRFMYATSYFIFSILTGYLSNIALIIMNIVICIIAGIFYYLFDKYQIPKTI